MPSRRAFIKTTSMATMAAAASAIARLGHAQQAPNSTGTERPKHAAPPFAADCHMHIYDAARFPMPPSRRMPPSNAAVPQYRLLQARIGTTRVVVVQPRNYAIDNRVTLDAIAQLGPDARGIAVLHPTVTDAELAALERGGIRGIRFTLGDPATAVVKVPGASPTAAGTFSSTSRVTRSSSSPISCAACRRRWCSIISRIRPWPRASSTPRTGSCAS